MLSTADSGQGPRAYLGPAVWGALTFFIIFAFLLLAERRWLGDRRVVGVARLLAPLGVDLGGWFLGVAVAREDVADQGRDGPAVGGARVPGTAHVLGGAVAVRGRLEEGVAAHGAPGPMPAWGMALGAGRADKDG